MEKEESFTNIFLESLETFVANIVNGKVTNGILNTIFIILLILWIYLGLKMFFDARNRYHLSTISQSLFLIFGVITGPIGYFLYNLTKPRYTAEELDFIKIEHKFYHHQASKVLDCINCKAYVLENHAFCTNCGVQNRFDCENCGALSDYNDKFCFSCGINFKNRKEKILNSLNKNSKSKKVESTSTELNTQKKDLGSDINKLYSSVKENVVNNVQKVSEKKQSPIPPQANFSDLEYKRNENEKKDASDNSQNKNKKNKKNRN